MLVEQSVGSNIKIAWIPLLTFHSQYVATKLLWWWGEWVHWIVSMTSLYYYYDLSFEIVEHSVCHQAPFLLINVFTLLASCLLSTLLILTLTMCEFHHWSSIAVMLPQSHYRPEEHGRIGCSSWLHYICFMFLALCPLSTLCVINQFLF